MPEFMPGGEPFAFDGGPVGALLIHGFTGAPNEMRGLGEYLVARGMTVLGVRLAGHGTNIYDMEKTGWRDWYASAKAGLEELRARCEQVFVMGLSLGGALTLHLGAHNQVAGLVALATPIQVDDWRIPWLPVLKHFIRFSKKGPDDFHDPSVAEWHVDYDHQPTRCAISLLAFLRHLNEDLPEIEAPLLLMHSRADTQVPPRNMPYIYERVGSTDKEIVWLENSGHVVTEDLDKDEVFRRAWEFVQRLGGPLLQVRSETP